MIRSIIALPYELARLPVTMIDNRLSGKLPETSVPRVTLHRAMGSADRIAGSLLGNRDIAQRGADTIERTDKLVRAARLEQQAATQREQARETATAGVQEAAQQRKDAQETAASGLEEADVAEALGKQQAKADAAKAAAKKKAAADKRAAARTATAEQRKARVESAAEAKQQAAQREAKGELAEARETKQEAAEARADADRLKDLTEAKKQDRTASE